MNPTDKQGFFKDMKELGEEYVQERITLLKLEGAEKAARMSAVTITGVILGVLLFFVLFFLSLLVAFFLSEKTGSLHIGLGVVAAFYLLLALLVFALRKTRIYPKITDAVIRLLFEKSESGDE